MAKRVGVDKWIFFTTLLLVVAGLVMVFSASAVVAQERYNSPYGFVMRQALWAVAGILAMIVLSRIDYARYNSPRFIYPALVITTLLLIVVLFFHDSHHTHRWIRFGAFSFQPSEIAKPVHHSVSGAGFCPRGLTRCRTGATRCCAPPLCRSCSCC